MVCIGQDLRYKSNYIYVMSLLAVFDKYFTKEDAEYYNNLFLTNGLNPLVDTPKESFNAIFGNTQIDLQYVLRLPAEEFIKASRCIENEIRKAGLPDDYYLNNFDDKELYEIQKNPENWSRQDVITAKIILENRNIPIDEKQLNEERAAIRINEKNKRKISYPTLILLYLLSPFGAFFAMFAGLMINYIKDTDIDGQKDFVFGEAYRKHGLILAGIGLLSIIGWLIVFDLISLQ